MKKSHFDTWHTYYQGDNIFIPVGNDFGFKNASRNFENLDKLIDYWNSHPEENVTARYSTPSEFLEAFLMGLNSTLTYKEGDFFPHMEKGMWTGLTYNFIIIVFRYFSSKQPLKYIIR